MLLVLGLGLVLVLDEVAGARKGRVNFLTRGGMKVKGGRKEGRDMTWKIMMV